MPSTAVLAKFSKPCHKPEIPCSDFPKRPACPIPPRPAAAASTRCPQPAPEPRLTGNAETLNIPKYPLISLEILTSSPETLNLAKNLHFQPQGCLGLGLVAVQGLWYFNGQPKTRPPAQPGSPSVAISHEVRELHAPDSFVLDF